MAIIPAAQWLPDQADLVDSGTSTARNILPRTDKSYGPMPSLSVFSGALNNRCQGAIGVSDAAGNSYTFAGDSTKLWLLQSGSTSWSDVSKVAQYTVASDQRVSFTFWTPNLVLATDFADAVQAYTIGTSALFADLSSGAPKAKYIAIIRDFPMLFNVFDATDGARPTRAHWGGIGAPGSWPVAGTAAAQAVQSDFQDINLGDFGQGVGIVGGLGSADGALFFERGIVRIDYMGAPVIFRFVAMEGGRGCSAPGSIAQLGAIVIFLGPDDLYAFDGATCQGLGTQQFCNFLFRDIDQSKMYRICAAFDPINQIYFLAYPSANNVNGNPNKILAYHWILKRATLIDALGDVELLFRSLSFGFTLEGLDAISSSLDALPFSLDSRAFTGGALQLSAFDSSHKLNYFTGTSLPATLDTSEAQLIPNRRAFVSTVRPLVDQGNPSVAVATRERQIDTKTFGAAVAINSVGESPQRASGRYHTARITLAAADPFQQIFGVDVPDDAVADDGDR